MEASRWPLVSVLFITYKRFEHLQRSVLSFRGNTDYPNLEIVIADDGSGPEIQTEIRKLPAHRFALAPNNRGLGANNNSGLRLCTGKYILMIQDDWLCRGPSDYLSNAVAVLESNPGIGIINFAGANHPPDYTQPLKGSNEACYITPVPLQESAREQFLYSDQPHIQTRAALEYVGLYKEDRDMEECEIDYNYRWRDQTRFRTAVFPAYFGRVFSDNGQTCSFRTSRVRYRVGGALQPLKPFLPARVIRAGKFAIMKTIYGLEKLRVVR